MTETPTVLAPAEGDATVPARGEWDARVLQALAERRELTHAGVSAMPEEDLLALGKALGAVRRDADRMMAVVAAEQATRSRAKAGKMGLARRKGKGDERGLVSAQTGGSEAEAGRLIEMGETLRDAEQAETNPADPPPEGNEQPAPRPVFVVVAQAVTAGQLSAEASSMITRMLKRIAKRCDAAAVAQAEKSLVFAAGHMRLPRLAGLITRTEERLDREHREELARDRRERRFLRIGEAADGMITISGRLDPENGAPLVTVMQAMVNQNFRLRKRMQDAAKAGESVVVDERTPEQVRADAMGDFARHLAGCDVEVLPRSGVTVVVRTTLEELREGLDGATVDGLSTSVDAAALRRMASDAGVIPQVMGGPSVVLDQGRAKRSFTHAQKLALVERDGGCALCGAPPSWCDAHHIVPWSRGGRTDMDNGVMLCVRCHHDVHRDGWQIHATPEEVSFTPPASVDPKRRRRPGGRRLFDAFPFSDDAGGVPAVPQGREVEQENCALAAREPCVSVPADSHPAVPLDDEPAAPPDPVPLHSQATRRTIDARDHLPALRQGVQGRRGRLCRHREPGSYQGVRRRTGKAPPPR